MESYIRISLSEYIDPYQLQWFDHSGYNKIWWEPFPPARTCDTGATNVKVGPPHPPATHVAPMVGKRRPWHACKKTGERCQTNPKEKNRKTVPSVSVDQTKCLPLSHGGSVSK